MSGPGNPFDSAESSQPEREPLPFAGSFIHLAKHKDPHHDPH